MNEVASDQLPVTSWQKTQILSPNWQLGNWPLETSSVYLPGGRIIGGAVAGDVGGGAAAGGLTIMPGFGTPIGPVGWPGDVAGLIVIGP